MLQHYKDLQLHVALPFDSCTRGSAAGPRWRLRPRPPLQASVPCSPISCSHPLRRQEFSLEAVSPGVGGQKSAIGLHGRSPGKGFGISPGKNLVSPSFPSFPFPSLPFSFLPLISLPRSFSLPCPSSH